MPPKPLPRDRLNPPTNASGATAGDWGHAMQGRFTRNLLSAKASFYKRMSTPLPVADEVAKSVSDPQSKQEIHESIIAPSGDHIGAGIHKKSLDMVSSVLEETMPGAIVSPPPLNLFQPYAVAPCAHLRLHFEHWCNRFYPEVHTGTIRARIDRKSPLLRIFMAYIKPLEAESYAHGVARAQFAREWMNLTSDQHLRRLGKMPLLNLLSQLFNMWVKCVTRLEQQGHWGDAESSLRDDIVQRSQFFNMLVEQGDTVLKLKEKEMAAWNAVWATSQGELYSKATHPYLRDIVEVEGELRCGEKTAIRRKRDGDRANKGNKEIVAGKARARRRK
jgi:hypothetical protein